MDSLSLKELIAKYIKEHVSEKSFPKETKINLERIFEFTSLKKEDIKGILDQSY